LIESGFEDWAGGSGSCSDANPSAYFALCPNIAAPHALPWGSAEFLGKCDLDYLTNNVRADMVHRSWLLGVRDNHFVREIWVAYHEVY
jgi:hypothetical protein